MMGGTRVWARAQWRHWWTSLVLATFVLALTCTLALVAITRAHRTTGAFDRLRAKTFATDVVVDGSDQLDADQATIGRLLPLIGGSGATIETLFFIRPSGSKLVPSFQINPAVNTPLLDDPTNRPVVVTGRLPNPDASNEIALGQQMAAELGAHVGDTIAFDSFSPEYVKKLFSNVDPGPADGPDLRLVVTGISVSPLDFSVPRGTISLTPSFADEYADRIEHFQLAQVALSDPRVAAEMLRSGHPSSGDAQLDAGLSVRPSAWSDLAQVSDGLGVLSTALWLFGIVVAIAGVLAFGLLIARLARSLTPDFDSLAAMGLGRSGRTQYGLALVTPVLLGGVAIGAIGAIAMAPNVGFELIDQVDPSGGRNVDWLPLTFGLATIAIAAMVVVITVFATSRRRSAPIRVSSHQRPALNRPLTLVFGVRNALTSGDGRGRSFTMAIAAAFLMAVAVAGLVCGASLTQLPHQSVLWGGGSDGTLDFGERNGDEPNRPYENALAALASDARLESMSGHKVFYPQIAGSDTTAWAIDTRLGEPILTVISGRVPRGADEIVLGRATMRRLGVQIGDEVPISLGGSTESFRIVGQAAFPVGDFKFDDGAALTIEAARRFPTLEEATGVDQILLTFTDGVDKVQATKDLTAQGYDVFTALPTPPVVTHLAQVQRLPTTLAMFFGLLGIVAVSYGLIVSRTGRRRQLAILTALGVQPRSGDAIMGWHAVTLGVIASVIGVPLGIIGGRAVWSAIAEQAGLGVAYSTPVGALSVAVALALLLPFVIEIILSRSARRQSVASSLRAD